MCAQLSRTSLSKVIFTNWHQCGLATALRCRHCTLSQFCTVYYQRTTMTKPASQKSTTFARWDHDPNAPKCPNDTMHCLNSNLSRKTTCMMSPHTTLPNGRLIITITIAFAVAALTVAVTQVAIAITTIPARFCQIGADIATQLTARFIRCMLVGTLWTTPRPKFSPNVRSAEEFSAGSKNMGRARLQELLKEGMGVHNVSIKAKSKPIVGGEPACAGAEE
jgi:hypothetical protein